MNHTIKMGYYDSFRCKADQCSFTCCQEWRIPIDDETAKKWQKVKLRDTPKVLCHYIQKEDEDYMIELNEEKKCPFLSKEKLCKVVLELGEAFLAETCIRFPRRINQFEGRIEYAIDFGCPEAIDLIKQQVDSDLFVEEGKGKKEVSPLYELRNLMLALLEDEGYFLTERLLMIFYVLLELLQEAELSLESIEAYEDEDYFAALAEEMRKMETHAIDTLWERNELFLDIVQDYRAQEVYVNYLEELSQYAENLEQYYSDQELLEKLQQFEGFFLAYEKLIKNYWIAEVFASCLTEEMELQDVVVVFEWLVMTYSTMKHAIFIKWLMEDKQEVDYMLVREYITLISRVTGYEQEEIRDYLVKSFEDVILEWGYLALLLGEGKL
ncbi:hypothetical protein CS063_13200 [Sporanaerobium hydrogeniformans]|uniref:Uncharacterized protein n=1 Tax=Sporanaerobium hydrogeniformans TaxID=3072179 RepID=A0AC61D9K3_9FIRM|nr:flagellin lysine-N-methylase [Sporanaerobium hydrogeniformans]PHV69934.1 hypothetical protein CS063_13200 [Sporanaerobium hydrogeniformans]